MEISIVLLIIGFLLGGILNAQTILRNAKTKDTIKAVNDIFNGSHQFHKRYGAWPGTLQNAVANIPSLPAACVGNTTGVIATAAESACATEELIRSSMLKGTAGDHPIRLSGAITISLTGAPLAGVAGLPANWRNVVLIQNIDCDIAVQIDRQTDDGSTNTGNFRTALGVCGVAGIDQNENIPVASAAIRLD
ncbi:MAG: hypothetical protein H6R18_1325 [Proteobacteria bacterium]|nr:hypothetical protein [Pseudomonadota bacterium]